MDGDRYDRQVEIVKHDVDVLVDASVEAKVQAQGPAADTLQRGGLLWPKHGQHIGTHN